MTSTPTLQSPTGARVSTRTRLAIAGLALLAAVTISLVLALGGTDTDGGAIPDVGAVPAVRSDGGPSESSVAAAVSSRAATAPDEARIAAVVGGEPQPTGPDEARVAAAVGGR